MCHSYCVKHLRVEHRALGLGAMIDGAFSKTHFVNMLQVSRVDRNITARFGKSYERGLQKLGIVHVAAYAIQRVSIDKLIECCC